MADRLAAVAAAATIALTAAAFPGHAGTHAGAMAGRKCTANYEYHYDATSNPGTSWAKWTANSCGYWLRPFAHCHNGRQAIITTGKAVQAAGVRSNANCTASFNSLTGGGLDEKHHLADSWTRHWLWGN